MSLISQNAALGAATTTANREELELDDGNEPEAKPELSLVSKSKKKKKKNKKKKRSRDDDDDDDDDDTIKRIKPDQEKEMKRLERSLFGNLYAPPQFGTEDRDAEDASPLFFIDKSTAESDGKIPAYEEDLNLEAEEKGVKKPAWVDEDTEKLVVDLRKDGKLRKLIKKPGEFLISGAEYESRLRAIHAKLKPSTTDWAKLGSEDEGDNESEIDNGVAFDDDVDSVLRTSGQLVVKSNTKLLPGLLDYSKLVDANKAEKADAPINAVQFHRNGQLLLTGGFDKRLRFFQVDGKRNTKVQSVFIEDCPIYKATFMPDGSQVIASGRRKFFYSFDLVSGNFDKIGPLTGREERSLETFEVSPDSETIAFIGNEGYILLVSPKTKELIGTMKMNGTARSLVFVEDGKQLMSSGGDGQVYHWDLRMRRCIHRGVDEGCINGSALCASPDSSLFAAGSNSGIVNIYKREEFLGGKRKPLKTIENLTTEVNSMKFNHDAQILAICSKMKKNGFKLVHIPSFTVFSNWPGATSLVSPRCLDFSPGGGFMAVGNAAGNVLLYKLHHYQKA